ncbi:hypothetical protein Ddc_20612 [Ditylenchus destructor]|nr:hypothetical protein Ddc_20612 [Ditylenchus destructor]
MAFPKPISSSAKKHFLASQLLQIQTSHSQNLRRNTRAMPPAPAQQNRAPASSSSSVSNTASSRHNVTVSTSVIRPTLLAVVVIMSVISVSEGLACYETVNFGMGPDTDILFAYNAAFSMSEDDYRILTVCIYERYDFSRLLPMRDNTAVEFSFRCVCNYDLCNSEPNFSAYLGAIKADSFSAKRK